MLKTHFSSNSLHFFCAPCTTKKGMIIACTSVPNVQYSCNCKVRFTETRDLEDTYFMTIVYSADDLSEVLPTLCLIKISSLVDVIKQLPIHSILHHYYNVGPRFYNWRGLKPLGCELENYTCVFPRIQLSKA